MGNLRKFSYVEYGTLILGNGTTKNGSLATGTLDVYSGATVEFDEVANESWSWTIVGAGALDNVTSYTVTLTGTHSGFTGSTTGITW